MKSIYKLAASDAPQRAKDFKPAEGEIEAGEAAMITLVASLDHFQGAQQEAADDRR